MTLRIISLMFVLWLSSALGYSAQLKNVTVLQQANKTILYLTINGFYTHKLFMLPNPDRIVVDLNATSLDFNLKQLNVQNTLIQQIRSGQSDPKFLRLVFDTKQKVEVHSTAWQFKGKLTGLKIEVSGMKSAFLVSNSNKKVVTPITQNKPKLAIRHYIPPQSIKKPVYQKLRDVVLVLDAGHGGKDPGARGPHHSQEKNVVLAITLKLKKLIDSQPGMRAVLTRSGDYYVGLRERLSIARKYGGDVFISIHADAFNNPHSHGASVFALSQSGATSEAARWIAAKENYSELGGVNLGDLDDINGVVRSVLIDLSQTATINSSLQMGSQVLGRLQGFTVLHNNKVEQARFMVLKSPDIPSILIETGFISNPREESNLTSAAYQDRLSQAIFQGIKNYFWDSPPHGTRIEAMSSHKFHLVKKGETMATIAAQYHIPVSSLQAMNHLNRYSKLNSGQSLAIS